MKGWSSAESNKRTARLQVGPPYIPTRSLPPTPPRERLKQTVPGFNAPLRCTPRGRGSLPPDLRLPIVYARVWLGGRIGPNLQKSQTMEKKSTLLLSFLGRRDKTICNAALAQSQTLALALATFNKIDQDRYEAGIQT